MLESSNENLWSTQDEGYQDTKQKEMTLPYTRKGAWESLLTKYVGCGENLQILDVESDEALLAIILAGLNHSVTAVNRSQAMLDQTRLKIQAAGKSIDYLKAEAHALALPDESVDVIVSKNAVGLFPNPTEVYKEWFRVLKPSGKALVFDANWYLRFNNPKFQLQCDKYRLLAVKKGYQDTLMSVEQVNDPVAATIPLSFKRRPLWDHRAFRHCGFQQIEVEENIYKLVLDDPEQTLYYSTPMFAICATK
ncbi:methylase involved in ubiquinone/menaquinone biosynthesis [Desulfosporosinus orientis DSM 765]|uniref:Methylase involved in ubiquinone/menaquinone biosynthesis n=1 Tax=Desulfosporosinus orientis (strain ATCC 19365 / DSM 765 / NCIMB 8382 / VKM B-1628 / Singapore I) TaxID=768706 RepID=G7WA46_DESOD|nr:class I SAM-dependent methyltransferase [Desulfosporosinus orientis]AET66184.1 methylase involved in ubiquinone/menaquinone biosynthesis [Desulfosporosinus orientis DSM 765]